MIKVILIDDEENALISLELALKEYCPGIDVIGTATSAKDGIKEIQDKKPDAVFLDIQMPHMTGIEILETLEEERDFDVVFVTAYDDFALKAFRLSATDYLLKPLSVKDLVEAAKRLSERKGQTITLEHRTKKIRAALDGKISIANTSGNELIDLNDIVRIQADGSYSNIYFAERKPLLVSKNLKEFEETLEGESFFRVHKSHLINLKYVQEYLPVKDGGTLKMKNGVLVEVSRTRKAELAHIFNNFTR